jgi:2-C-methyl-D-erythritol 4-phosphate cytidylyltransferase
VKVRLLIPAAGMGTRLGCDMPKALIPLEGQPMLVRTLERFRALGLIEGAAVTVPPGREGEFRKVLDEAYPGVALSLVAGGAERQDSVARGLDALDADTDIVVIHDAARPFVSAESVRASIEAAAECGAATVAVPCIDTILQADGERYLIDTPDRRTLWACQTPQTFRFEVIRAAHEAARRERYTGTDDASLVRRAGGRVRLVMGAPLNFKVTTPADRAMAESVIREGLA